MAVILIPILKLSLKPPNNDNIAMIASQRTSSAKPIIMVPSP